jgi:hypothetical protein
MRRVGNLRAKKAIGMSIDEALTFWRRGFQGGKISDDKFAKEYRYNIRHSYGLEGRRMNYPAKKYVSLLTCLSAHAFFALSPHPILRQPLFTHLLRRIPWNQHRFPPSKPASA